MLTQEQKNQLELEEKRISDNLQRIKRRIVIFSGKGGVGKTTVSINLAFGLSLSGKQVGLLDADVTGPNVPKMLGLTGNLQSGRDGILPLFYQGVKVISIAGMLPPDQPLIWRGPIRSKLLNQFLAEVEWGDLDYLIADLPPGTGDEIITMTQKMKPHMAIVVTTPQEVSLLDCSRAITMARKMEIHRVGVIENMSGLICPKCGERIDLFGAGGGEKLAKRMQAEFLGALPFDLETRKSCDGGVPMVMKEEGNVMSDLFSGLIAKIEKE
jgi:ATP-binding protein involved in chromosome partitioning